MYVFHLKGMFTVFVFQLYLANSGRLSPLTSATVNPVTQNGKLKGKGGGQDPKGTSPGLRLCRDANSIFMYFLN